MDDHVWLGERLVSPSMSDISIWVCVKIVLLWWIDRSVAYHLPNGFSRSRFSRVRVYLRKFLQMFHAVVGFCWCVHCMEDFHCFEPSINYGIIILC